MRKLLNIIISLIFFNACSTAPKQKTQLEIREFQTRYFQVNDKNIVIKAVINTLLDEGYIIKNANTDIGFITAEKGYDINQEKIESKSNNVWGVIILGALIVLTIGLIIWLSKSSDKDKDDKKDDKNNKGNTNTGSSETSYEKNKIIETTINISEFSNGYKVRAVFQYKTYDNKGNLVKIKQIDDMKFYQEFFSKVDKSIFLQKELENK